MYSEPYIVVAVLPNVQGMDHVQLYVGEPRSREGVKELLQGERVEYASINVPDGKVDMNDPLTHIRKWRGKEEAVTLIVQIDPQK